MQNLGGQTECIMGNWKIENSDRTRIKSFLRRLKNNDMFYEKLYRNTFNIRL